MSNGKIDELLQYYQEHSDQEFVKIVLEALKDGEITEDELVVIGDWIAAHASHKRRAMAPSARI